MQVESIKERLPGTERLVYAGKDLDDGSTLAANGIPKEATLEALGRLFGGGKGSGGGASKPTKGVAAGRRALTAIMATRKMQAGADASEGAEGSNQAVGGAASAADARRQTTTSDADALAAKDREIAALQRRIDEVELAAQPGVHAHGEGREVHTVTATAPTATTTTPAGDSADADAVLTTSRSQAHVGHARFLRKKVAADPEAFFGKADADNSDDLSPDEWRATCKLFVADIDDSTVRTLFGEIAGEGATISRPRFFKVAEEYRAARQFVEESKCVDMLVDDLIMMVGDKRSRMTPVQGDQSDQSGADQMSAVLASLDKADGQSLVASLATALCEHAAALKDKLAARVSCEEKQNQADTDNKFSNLPEAAYGEVADFHTGLEVVGIPHPRTRDEMHKEHTQKADSQEEFEAWNSGKNVTTPQKEWDFVVEPFDPASVCAGTLPANWEPKHADYGGNRAPIRLQVFLHATSATCASEQGVIAFGNYKHAGGLKDSDELWLHPEEVSMVKVVLLRFVKSQLDGLSLRAAYTNKKIAVEEKAAEPKADKIVKALSTYLGETDGAASKSTFGGVVQALEKDNVASAEELEALMDYFHAKFALEKLTEAEVIAARMYTGPG